MWKAVSMGGPTSKVGPLLGLLEEAMLSGLLSTPNHTSRCSGGVEAGVGEMSGDGLAMVHGESWRTSTPRGQLETAGEPCWMPLRERSVLLSFLFYFGFRCLPFTPGSPMEKRLAGLGTPVFRLMLKRRDSKPKPKMPDAMIADFRLQSKGGGNEKRQIAPAKQC